MLGHSEYQVIVTLESKDQHALRSAVKSLSVQLPKDIIVKVETDNAPGFLAQAVRRRRFVIRNPKPSVCDLEGGAVRLVRGEGGGKIKMRQREGQGGKIGRDSHPLVHAWKPSMSILQVETSFVVTDGSFVLLQGSFIASLSKKKMKRKGSIQMGDVPKY